MVLITGGAWQGKKDFAVNYVQNRRARQSSVNTQRIQMADGADADTESLKRADVITNLHAWIARLLREGEDPYKQAEWLMKENPDAVITVNELGCGIVPVDAFDRQWRELTGRICCHIAARAESVYRVTCGVGNKIK